MASTWLAPAAWLLRQAVTFNSTSAMHAPAAALPGPADAVCGAATGLLITHLLSKAFIRAVCQQVGPNIAQQVHQQQLALQCCCVVVIAHGGGKVLILTPCGNVHGGAVPNAGCN